MDDLLMLLVESWHLPIVAAWLVISIGGSIWVTRNLTDEERARFPYL